ncbi:MAG: PorT family protein [Bacteroidetes bacterium]|nr:PorT family protein [Bacteroidota bacterium]
MLKKIFFLSLILFIVKTGNSQILISWLLGDKLNSPNIEFGMDGGLSLTNDLGNKKSTYLRTFNLGFYFDFKLKSPNWKFNTGLRVKSNMGANDIPVYSLNNVTSDSIFKDGSISRQLGYFYLPVLLKYQFKNQFYIEGGLQAGLRTKATDTFKKSVNEEDDLNYELDVSKQFARLDAGITGGIGYRLMGGNGMNLGIRGYLGLVDVSKTALPSSLKNYGWYFNVGIPIGKAKSSKNP